MSNSLTTFLRAYVAFLDRRPVKLTVFVVWILLAVAGLISYIPLTRRTERYVAGCVLRRLSFATSTHSHQQYNKARLLALRSDVDPPTGSPSYHAQQLLKAEYPLSANEDVVAIVVQQQGAGPSAEGTRVGVAEASASSSGGIVFSPDAGYDFSGFSAALNRSVGDYGASNGGAVTAFQPSLVLEGGSKKAFAADFFTLNSLSLGSFAWQAVAPNPLANFSLPPPDKPSNVTSLAFRLIVAGNDKKKEDTGDWLQDELSVLCDRYFGGKAECLLTGAPLFMQQIAHGTEDSMIHGESIAAPIAIVILGVLVRSGRLLARECGPSLSICTCVPVCFYIYIHTHTYIR